MCAPSVPEKARNDNHRCKKAAEVTASWALSPLQHCKSALPPYNMNIGGDRAPAMKHRAA